MANQPLLISVFNSNKDAEKSTRKTLIKQFFKLMRNWTVDMNWIKTYENQKYQSPSEIYFDELVQASRCIAIEDGIPPKIFEQYVKKILEA